MSRSSPKAVRPSRRAAAIGVVESVEVADDAHALAAAACRRLEDERRPTPTRSRDERLVRLVGVVVAGDDREIPRLVASRRAAALSPRARMAAGGGPTQRIPAADHALGEVGVLAQEAEARMDGVGAHRSGRGNDRRCVQEVDRRLARPRQG